MVVQGPTDAGCAFREQTIHKCEWESDSHSGPMGTGKWK